MKDYMYVFLFNFMNTLVPKNYENHKMEVLELKKFLVFSIKPCNNDNKINKIPRIFNDVSFNQLNIKCTN